MEDRIHGIGERVGSYEVLGHLSTGGFSTLYVAKAVEPGEHRVLGRPVALKLSRHDGRSLSAEERSRYNDRLTREFELLATLRHPGIVRVHERQCHDGLAFYAMELLEGPTLARWLGTERRSYLDLMRVLRRLAEALAVVHRGGVVHRDLKPSNVVLVADEAEPGAVRPVLIDFGISQGLGRAPVTLPGALVGTAELLSPEYARKAQEKRLKSAYRASPPEDVYQLGVLLYRMLTGRSPTRTAPEQLIELLMEIWLVVPKHPLELNPEAPPALAELAMACLAKDEAERPADGAELVKWLDEALERDAEALGKLAPELSPGDDAHVSEMVEATVSGSAGEEAQNGPVLSPREVAALVKQVQRTERSVRRVRREVREITRSNQAFVLVMCGVFIVLLGLGVALGPFVWKPEVQQPLAPNNTNPVVPFTELFPGGLKMPDKPEPGWMHPTAQGKCILRGRELDVGYSVFRDTCWVRTGTKKNPAEGCPTPFYSAPDDAPAELKDGCFMPVPASGLPPQSMDSDGGSK